MSRPILGILGNTLMTQPGRFSSIERAYINSDYADGVIRNGGIPVMIPAASMMEDVEAALGFCDGILFPGGEDMIHGIIMKNRSLRSRRPDRR